MAFNKYVGVWFQNSWAVVPRKWIFKDTIGYKCYWPKTGNVEELSRTETVPLRKYWSIWNIEEPDVSHDNYDQVTKLMVEATTASEWEGDESAILAPSEKSSSPNLEENVIKSLQASKILSSPRRSPRHTKNCELPTNPILPRRSPRRFTSVFQKRVQVNVDKNQPSTSGCLVSSPRTKRRLMFRDLPVGALSSEDEDSLVTVQKVPILPTADFNPELTHLEEVAVRRFSLHPAPTTLSWLKNLITTFSSLSLIDSLASQFFNGCVNGYISLLQFTIKLQKLQNTTIQSIPEEAEWGKFLKKKILENNLLLKEILQKLGNQVVDSPSINVAKTKPCPADDEENLKAICNLENIVSYLVSLKEGTLSRTVTAMIKAIMSRELALKYSMTGLDNKRQKTKLKFKGSTACLKIEEALSEIIDFNKLSRHSVHTTMGISLKNATDWDGHRGTRKKKGTGTVESQHESPIPPTHSTPLVKEPLVTQVGELSFLNL